MNNNQRGWVYTKENTEIEIGFADADEYRNASDAVDGFDYHDHFSVYFRDSNGVLHSCEAESEPDDFEDDAYFKSLEDQ